MGVACKLVETGYLPETQSTSNLWLKRWFFERRSAVLAWYQWVACVTELVVGFISTY